MSGFGALYRLGVTVRPLVDKPPCGYTRATFTASLTATCELLYRELGQLVAHRVVLELDLRERDIRVDGMPRADSRPSHPGVGLSFDSHHGPLRYATAEFTDWADNLRAIALGLEALRRVDRYGISRRGEQYGGWRQLPQSTDPADQIQTVGQAQELIEEYGSLGEALKATHPDRGGDAGDFRRVMRAKELLGA